MRLRGKRGVSDVIGTILILALTVTLFSSIFFFVNSFPKPATQPASQFSGLLNYTSIGTKTYVSFLTVTHLGGPTLPNFNTQIYVVSQAHPQNTTIVYTLVSGGLPGGVQATWGTGQVWSISLAGPHLATPDNITITIVSANIVVYRQILPGSNPTIPPIFVQEGTTPGSPVVNAAFSIFVQITDPFLSTASKRVYLNITTPGLTCSGLNANGTHQMTYNATNGLWFAGGCTSAVSGTYYVSVWATDKNPILPLQNSIIFPVAVGSSGGGPACSNTYTATLSAAPTSTTDNQPVTLTLTVTNGNACDWIYISGNYTGSVTAGTYTNPSPKTYSLLTVPVGGSLVLTTTWTTPAKTCGGGGSTCTGTATLTFTFSYSSGATGPVTKVVTVTY